MRKTIRLINLEHDARDVACIDASLAHESGKYETYRVDSLASVPSEEMSERLGVTVRNMCTADVDGACMLNRAREIKPHISNLMIADAYTEEPGAEYLCACAADYTAAPRRRSS
jgi:hypothetical protein